MTDAWAGIIKEAMTEAAPKAIEAIGKAFKDKVKADVRVRHGNAQIDEKTLDAQTKAFMAQYDALIHAAAPFEKIEHHYLYRSKGFGDMTENLAKRLAELQTERSGLTGERHKCEQLYTNALHQILMTYQTTDPQHPMDYWAERMERLVNPADIDKVLEGEDYERFTKQYLSLLKQSPGFFELTMRLNNFEGEIHHAPFDQHLGKKLGEELKHELRWTGEIDATGHVKSVGHGFGIGTETVNAVKRAAFKHAQTIAKEYR